jgi:hypothetical protein
VTLENMSDVEILAVANPIMDNLMDASTAIDHARHVRDFSERMQRVVTPEHLQTVDILWTTRLCSGWAR